MTPLDSLLAGPVVHRLGWTLLHSLWQIALIAVLLWIVLLFLKRRSAASRYVAGCLALVLMAALPAGTLWLSMSQAVAPNARVLAPAPAAGAASADLLPPWDAPAADRASSPARDATQPPARPWHARLGGWLEPNLRWIVAAWMAGVAALSLRIVVGWLAAQRLRRRCCAAVSAAWQARFAELARRIGVSRPVRLLESSLAEVPTVIGHLRPVILLPISALAGLSPQQVEAILAHELAHIRRHDYLVNLAQVVIETLLFYHPAVWWISRRIRIERENCCDDMAVEVCGDRFAYIRALVSLEETRGEIAPEPRVAVAWQGTSLLDRARRLLGTPSLQTPHPARWMAGPVLLVAALVVTLVLALSPGLHAAEDDRQDASTALSRPQGQWLQYVVTEVQENTAGQKVLQLAYALPKEFEQDKGPRPPLEIVAHVWTIRYGGMGDPSWVMADVLGDLARSPATTRPVPLPEGQAMILTEEQTRRFLAVPKRRSTNGIDVHPWVMSGPGSNHVIGQAGRIEVQVPDTTGQKVCLSIPRDHIEAWDMALAGKDTVKMDLLLRALQQQGTLDERPLLWLWEARVARDVPLGQALLLRPHVHSARPTACRMRMAEESKPQQVDIFFEFQESDQTQRAVLYALLPERVNPNDIATQAAADAPVSRQGAEEAGPEGPTQFPADAAERLAAFPINDAKLSDVIAAFGKPKVYRDGGKILDENALPDAYCMDYGNGFMVWVGQGKVQELRLEKQTPPEMADFACQGRLKLGSSLDDALAVMGPPDWVQEGGPLQYHEGVLYKDFDGHKGAGYYQRLEKGLRLWIDLDNDKVMSLYITRKRSLDPMAPLDEAAAFNVDLQAKVAQMRLHATREEVIAIFGKPIRYFDNDGICAEDELPNR